MSTGADIILPTHRRPHTIAYAIYAIHWDARYPRLEAPPQRVYLERLTDADWRRETRGRVAESARPLAVRASRVCTART